MIIITALPSLYPLRRFTVSQASTTGHTPKIILQTEGKNSIIYLLLIQYLDENETPVSDFRSLHYCELSQFNIQLEHTPHFIADKRDGISISGSLLGCEQVCR